MANVAHYIGTMHRDTVMRLISEVDYDGVQQRAKKRLKRRVYRCKVYTCTDCLSKHVIHLSQGKIILIVIPGVVPQ